MERIPSSPPAWARYATAVASVVVATLIHLPLRAFLDQTIPYLLLCPAIALSAFLGGTGPGLLAVGMSTVMLDVLFLEPFYHYDFTMPAHSVGLAAFASVGAFLAIVCGSARRANLRAERTVKAAAAAEEALRQGQERYQSILNRAPVPIIVTRGRTILYVNDACLKMFRYATLSDLRGRQGIDLVAPRHRAEVSERNRQRELGRSVPESYETVGLREDGTTLPVRLDAARLDLEDGPATVCFISDLSPVERVVPEARPADGLTDSSSELPSPLPPSDDPIPAEV